MRKQGRRLLQNRCARMRFSKAVVASEMEVWATPPLHNGAFINSFAEDSIGHAMFLPLRRPAACDRAASIPGVTWGKVLRCRAEGWKG